jgi:putative endonuclease
VNRLVYYEQFSDPISPITREKEIKGWRREKKNKLVETLNPTWDDLTEWLFGAGRRPARSPQEKCGEEQRPIVQ